MCQPLSQGGKRCAAHARPRYEAAAFGTTQWDEAAAQYAMTQEGRTHLLSVIHAATADQDWERVAAHTAAVERGEQSLSALEAFKATARASRSNANDKKTVVRTAERSTDPDVLRDLHRRKRDQETQVALASNPHCPHDVAMALSGSKFVAVRGALAGRRSLPSDVYEMLMRDRNPEVRDLLYRFCESVPEVAVRAWVASEEEGVRERAAREAGRAMSDVLASLAADDSTWVRAAVAGNPHTTADVLRDLCADDDMAVVHAAMRNPTLSQPDLATALAASERDLCGYLDDSELADLQAHMELRGITGAFADAF